MALQRVTLDDKYDLTQRRVFVTGYQALVRMCLLQKERDRRAGLNTAGYITGMRFYKSLANTGTHTGTLWTSAGQKLATATFAAVLKMLTGISSA